MTIPSRHRLLSDTQLRAGEPDCRAIVKHACHVYLSSLAYCTPVCANALEKIMRLTNFSDFALRLLMYAAAREDRLITIEEASEVYNISRAHLMKIANTLTKAGYLKAVRGRSGGLALAKPPHRIKLGDVIRTTEPDFALVECFGAGNECVITRSCRLRGILHEGLEAFNAVLDKYTLADLMIRPKYFGVRPAA
jgi:Rrf2 family nitric oxide-sensitive transcriptional repressor